MHRPLAVTIWRISLTWGVLSLAAGVWATIAIGANGSLLSLNAWLTLVFALPIVAVFAAQRSPVLAGAGLLLALAAVALGAVSQDGAGAVPAILRDDYVWLHSVFGLVFLLLKKHVRRAFPTHAEWLEVPRWNGRSRVQSWMGIRNPRANRHRG